MLKLSEQDRRLNVEGRILDILSKHGGERLVAGPAMEKLIQELTDEYFTMREDGL